MKIRDIGIKNSYTGKGSKILKEFLLPSLQTAREYDRITGYFTMESLLAVSQGIEKIYENKGKMRLIIGIHSIPEDIVEASLQRKYMEEQISIIREEINRKILTIKDSLRKKQLVTVAWMIEDNLLEVKAAAVIGMGIFHPKTCIITDTHGDSVAAVGSPNETSNGLGGNFEQLVVLKSWECQEAVEDQKGFFESLWSNQMEDAVVMDITQETFDMIKNPINLEGYRKQGECNSNKKIIENAAKMPANFFVSGDVPALYMHQERAVLDALSRWPIRVLFADEVGLGKTFEVAATVVFLIKYCSVKRVIILTPKSVLKQWQDELYEHFGLSMWLYDSGKKSYISPEGRMMTMGMRNPVGKGSPDLILMSSQLARGSGKSSNLLSREDTILPDVLVVDEAHSARISKDISGKRKKTRMYKMLEECTKKIPHLILATATPMQKEADEYHAILKLLGLPKGWTSISNYRTSLKLIGRDNAPDPSDGSTAANLLKATADFMKPSLARLSEEETNILSELLAHFNEYDQYDRGIFVAENWSVLRRVFIKLHPAQLLTVRNTRRSLAEVGYKFPERNLKEINVENSSKIQMFYSRVNEYLEEDCFSIEHALYPGRKINIGFVRVSYQQRVASSLYSCRESLIRRRDKVLDIKDVVDRNMNLQNLEVDEFEINSSIEDFELDDMFINGDEDVYGDENKNEIDIVELQRAVNLEYLSLNSLINQSTVLLNECGDMKINRSIKLAIECLEKGDSVLLFSRYTDTISALIEEFDRQGVDDQFVYGIYTGKESVIVSRGTKEACDKNRIKQELFAKRMRLVFCSDAASEGLNLQAARVLINVDVPWTPARLEQRIGRIARLGQRASEVDIYNVWYPNSIEARMYHRIQTRLEETNLAIGEFPEVVAENIKKSILDEEAVDSSLTMLKEMRNDYQRKALEELWSNPDYRITTTDLMRQQLLSLCEKEFERTDETKNNLAEGYVMPDGTIEYLSKESGMAESISLKSKPWKFVDYQLQNMDIIENNNGLEIGFKSTKSEEMYIPHEKVLEYAKGGEIKEEVELSCRPTMLPDFEKINLLYSVEIPMGTIPVLWPEDYMID